MYGRPRRDRPGPSTERRKGFLPLRVGCHQCGFQAIVAVVSDQELIAVHVKGIRVTELALHQPFLEPAAVDAIVGDAEDVTIRIIDDRFRCQETSRSSFGNSAPAV